jgi:dinuclear metal center YbgI/SA1388 family protein
MVLGEILDYLESMAPPSLQESYDNSGLIVGSRDWEIHAALVSLDCTPAIVEEAKAKGCNLIIAHHPIVFSGLKKFNGKNYIERAVMAAIKNDIAIYAIHTNLDNVHTGVNAKMASRLGLTDTRILQPKKGLLQKLVVFVPSTHAEVVLEAMFDAGAGHIGNYSECHFAQEGIGTFKAGATSNPFVGEKGQRHAEREQRLECVVPSWLSRKVISAMTAAHPYEEVAYDLYALENAHPQVGAGLIGELEHAMPVLDFLNLLKNKFNAKGIRYTEPHKSTIKRVALCGGSGSFLLNDAMGAKADIFITGDYKYHQFFDADGQIIIADIGHYESEQFTMELISDGLAKKFATFATHLTELDTNPIRYM